MKQAFINACVGSAAAVMVWGVTKIAGADFGVASSGAAALLGGVGGLAASVTRRFNP